MLLASTWFYEKMLIFAYLWLSVDKEFLKRAIDAYQQ